MQTTTLQILLTKEINELNRRIDRKIVEGKPYKEDAHMHKVLLRKLKRLNQARRRKVSVTSFLAA